MAAEKPTGFFVSQGRIALAISVITLFAFFYQVAAFAQSTQFRIESLEKFQAETVELNERLVTAISELNMTLREVQVRQETK